MDITNNIFIIIFALLPIILYVYLLYYMIPKTFVSIDRGRRYLISGLMSPFLVILVYFIFPNWSKPLGTDILFNYIFFTVVQIGILEEASKYTIFKWVSSERLSQKHDLPIATVYYSLMTSLGFALTENISYLMTLYNIESINPLVTSSELNNDMLKMSISRSLTAVVMHMICGIIIGYFINLSKEVKKPINSDRHSTNHNFNIMGNFYVLIGILLASIYHGIYNLNLMLPDNNYKSLYGVLIMIYGLTISYFMIKNTITESKIKRFCRMN